MQSTVLEMLARAVARLGAWRARREKKATDEDLLPVPAPLVAEIIRGALITVPRPQLRHSRAAGLTSKQDARVRAEPFDALELDLSILWER